MLDERRDGDPLQGARISIAGTCTATAEPAAREQYLRRHPGAAMFAGFADFGIYRLGIARAHLVAGFGRIVDLAAGDVLTDVAGAESLAEAQAGAIAHMNADHSDVCRLFATKLLGAADGDWHCAGIDPEGIELQNGRTALRLFFPQRIIAPGPLRAMLKQMADAARAI
jgi:putative heme iron utilization protein